MRISQNSQEPPVLVPAPNKLAVLQLATLFKKETPAQASPYEFSRTPLGDWFFTISREVSHYPFLPVGFFNQTLLMKIFEDIFAMPVAKK